MPAMHERDSWFPFIDRLGDAAAAAILPHFRTRMAVDNKLEAGFDPVTVADRAAEEAMRAMIAAAHPDHGILGEEYDSHGLDAEHVWVLDPIDGTRAFISGLPVWGILIGLKRWGKPVAGMMVQPFTGERFAGDGRTSFYRGPDGSHPLRTRPCASLAEATLFTTSPNIFAGADKPGYDRVERAVRLARYGTDCYAYCMVAAGHADVVVEAGLKAVDIVALVPVIEGAGGVVTSWDGGDPCDGGRIVASGDPRVHEEALKLLAD
jgi:histidinol phosphatase-like enzyme (inositol monophosphatase family)